VDFTPFRSRALTDQMDVLATILEVGGLDPATCDSPPDGLSLVDRVLAGPDDVDAHSHRDRVLSEVYQHTMVFDGRHKVVVDEVDRQAVELYDLEDDPGERSNQVDMEDYRSIQEDATELVRSKLSL
jgi:arylsulfatase A-like enzyme